MEKYRIIKMLGEGGNSTAYLGQLMDTGDLVTIKKLKENENGVSVRARMSLENEGRILEELDNEAIPRLIEQGDDFLVVSYAAGNSLEKVMLVKGIFTEKEAVRIGKELLEILKYLHERNIPVIYRDLKPSNIVMRPDGHISLIDFGAARFYDCNSKGDTQNLGTYGFAAPEQYGNLGQTDPRTDIYCFGMTMLALVSGVDLTDEERVLDYRNSGITGVSDELLEVIEGCIRPDRDDRFVSADQVLKALLACPQKKFRRKMTSLVKLGITAAIVALMITLASMHIDTVTAYASTDMEERLPAVKQRLYNARCWLEEHVELPFVIEGQMELPFGIEEGTIK